MLLAVASVVVVSTPLGRSALLFALGRAAVYDGVTSGLTLGLYYACCVPALIALFCLDCLLANIMKDAVFTEENVKALRLISWCCFAEAFILAATALYFAPILLAVAVVAAFFGLILRVVKNVIDAAVALKSENDFTI
jgi:hypothetical protein